MQEFNTIAISKAGNRITVTKKPGQKVCISCGGFFQPKRSTAKYCADRCRVKYNRLNVT